jgi:hypothetical protein
MTCGGVGEIRHIEAGNYLNHARHFFRFRYVDALYQPVGYGGMEYFTHQSVTRS